MGARGKQIRTEVFSVRLSVAELRLIRKAAKADDRDASEWVRLVALKAAKGSR